MMPSTTATSVAALAPSRTSTSAADRMDQGSASGAGRSSAAMPGCWRTSASPCATTGSGSLSSPCSRPPAYSWLQAGSLGNSENRLLGNLWRRLSLNLYGMVFKPTTEGPDHPTVRASTRSSVQPFSTPIDRPAAGKGNGASFKLWIIRAPTRVGLLRSRPRRAAISRRASD